MTVPLHLFIHPLIVLFFFRGAQSGKATHVSDAANAKSAHPKHELCTPNTLFLCFCETFLTDEISDSELMIPDFTITRCDRRQRMGGGVCMYVKKLC